MNSKKAIVIPFNPHISFIGGTAVGSLIAHKMFADRKGAVFWDLAHGCSHDDVRTAYFYDTDQQVVNFKAKVMSMTSKYEITPEEAKYLPNWRMTNWAMGQDKGQVWLKLMEIYPLAQPHALKEFRKSSDNEELVRVQNYAIVNDPEFMTDNSPFTMVSFVDDFVYRLASQENEKLLEVHLEEMLWYKMLDNNLEFVERQKGKDDRLDLCFKDSNGTFVIIEIKRGLADLDVLGQIARYLDEVLASQKPRKMIGIILCRKASLSLRNAVADPETIGSLGHGHEIRIDEYKFSLEFPEIEKMLKAT